MERNALQALNSPEAGARPRLVLASGPTLTRRFDDPLPDPGTPAFDDGSSGIWRRAGSLLARLCDRHGGANIVTDSRAAMPDLGRGATSHCGAGLFEAFGVEAQVEVALVPRVRLQSGGELLFEPVRTLTLIDVDSAGASKGVRKVERINLEAAPVIVRQLRPRNIGGLVVVDYLNRRGRASGPGLDRALVDALRDDPCEAAVEGPTRFGTMEVARRRQGADAGRSCRLRPDGRHRPAAAPPARGSVGHGRPDPGGSGVRRGRRCAQGVRRRARHRPVAVVAETGRPHDYADIACGRRPA